MSHLYKKRKIEKEILGYEKDSCSNECRDRNGVTYT